MTRPEPRAVALAVLAGLVVACVVCGAVAAHLLAGPGWSLAFLSAASALLAVVLARGLSANG